MGERQNSRVDTGQDLSVEGLDVLDDDVTLRGGSTDRLGLAVSARSVKLAKVLSKAKNAKWRSARCK